MSHDRREFLRRSTVLGASMALPTLRPARTLPNDAGPQPPGQPFVDYVPVETPNGSSLPWRIVDGVKVFHLRAQRVRHVYTPGLEGNCWGFNGSTPGPTIEAVEGDRVRIYVTNELDEPTTVHWHGLIVPCGMDGVGGLTQRSIEPGETFRYEFELKQHGTFLYHSHHDEMVQMAMGMVGMFVVHPRVASEPKAERDFVLLLGEWAVPVGTERPNPLEMQDFNVLTINGKAFPSTAALVCKLGERVRIRVGNLSAMDHHPLHVHGHAFVVTATDGGVIPPAGRWPETAVLVATGQTRTIEFTADNPGDWGVHCHMTHHVMTQMGHNAPNLTGLDPSVFDAKLAEVVPEFEALGAIPSAPDAPDPTLPKNSVPMQGAKGPFGYITMGGMVTLLKVRAGITAYTDPGHYQHPPGTVADVASEDDLRRDGIAP